MQVKLENQYGFYAQLELCQGLNYEKTATKITLLATPRYNVMHVYSSVMYIISY